jgi:UDP-2,3-diacylglucosamine pyrophosphatase LpxH
MFANWKMFDWGVRSQKAARARMATRSRGLEESGLSTHKEETLFDAIMLSDLHLGSDSCQVKAVLEFLEAIPHTKRLILNGDVLENTEYRLTKQHWRVLSRLRKLSDDLELVWVRGNHDFDAESVAHLIGAAFVPEYLFESGSKQILCVHGDSWDRFLTEHPFVTTLVDWFYLYMQRMSRKLATRAKRSSKTFLRCVERIRAEATEYAKARQADVVICGHTHQAEATPQVDQDLPFYCNTGCWTDYHCHYLTALDGEIRLEEVNGENLGLETVVDLAPPKLEPSVGLYSQ